MTSVEYIDHAFKSVERHEIAVRLIVGWLIILTAVVTGLILRSRRK